jgi:hypothetical protein
MMSVDQQAARAAAESYAVAQEQYRAARNEANSAWVALQMSSGGTEPEARWQAARTREAELGDRLKNARRVYLAVGGEAVSGASG